MSMPKPDEASRKFFESILPEDTRVKVRPMFGNVAGFVNGNMFIGLFGSDVFVRLSEADKAELLREEEQVAAADGVRLSHEQFGKNRLGVHEGRG